LLLTRWDSASCRGAYWIRRKRKRRERDREAERAREQKRPLARGGEVSPFAQLVSRLLSERHNDMTGGETERVREKDG
jgi:hypothetical protein